MISPEKILVYDDLFFNILVVNLVTKEVKETNILNFEDWNKRILYFPLTKLVSVERLPLNQRILKSS